MPFDYGLLDIWRHKLASWRFDPEHPYREVTGAELAKHLAGAPEETVTELVSLFAAAFGLSYDEALRDVTHVPEPQLPSGAQQKPLPVDGLVARYVRWLSQQESPPQYHAFSLLTCVSAAIGRRSSFMLGPYPIFPNLYTILIGESGSRKDSAIDVARTVVENGTDFIHVLPVEGSAQGLVAALSDRCRDTGGIADGLIAVDEMRVLFGSRKDGYKADVPVWLTDWFKCPDVWERGLSKERVTLTNLYITLLAGTTEDWLEEMPPSVLKGGFFPRCLLVYASGKSHWKWAPAVNRSEGRAIATELTGVLLDVPPALTMSTQADAYMRDWYEGHLAKKSAEAPTWVKTYIERAHVQAVKLAVLTNVIESRGAEITLESATQAVALVEWIIDSAQEILRKLDTSDHARVYEDVVAWLVKHGGQATVKKLCRGLRNKYRAREVQTAVADLRAHGEVTLGSVAGETVVVLHSGE